MFEQISDQIQKSMSPFTELLNINAKVAEQLVQQQASLFSGLMNYNVAYAQGLAEQKDLTSAMEAQKAYAEGMQEKLTTAAKDAYGVVSLTQEKTGNIFNSAFSAVKETVTTKTTKANVK